MRARSLLFMGALLGTFARPVAAEPWSIEPRLGASAEYDTNPGLSEFDPTSERHVAALIDLPLRYDGDGIEIGFRPNGRVSNSRGYSSLASDYADLDMNAQLTSDRWSASVQGGLARDTSLLHAGELANGVGVRRDSAITSADWSEFLTERGQIQMDAGWSYVKYAQSQGVTELTDYRYVNAGPSFVYALSERNSLKAIATYGNYESVNGLTQSKSEQAQLGFTRRLNEIWSLSVTAGYSRSVNSEKYFFGPFYLGTARFDQNGTVYAVNLTRQGEKLNLTAGVSESLQPTGLAFLSRENSVNLNGTYTYSERWDFALKGAWQKLQNPGSVGGESSVKFLSAELAANWHWTPQWLISMRIGRLTQELGSPMSSAASSGVTLDVIRQFLRTDL